ncbi:uncharacterized protein LOC114733354 [Neltuma alba]|uniref:uncharacterized protein LOC114733354 n=1 Tax=Neltuma alba TaxID=207710 RepID=UPI0010A4AF20|nr:uncharacterized protein LOC114733354 [Prosopis alba]
MASYPVRNSCSPHGYSKAQMCFFKILRVISSVPPCQQQPLLTPKHDPSNSSPSTRGSDVDSNLQFGAAEFQCSASDSSGVEETNGGHDSADVSGTKETGFREPISEDPGGKEPEEEARETVPFGGNRRASYDNCLDLLIEAAKLVLEEPSGEMGPGSELRTGSRNREEQREQRWVVADLCKEVNDTTPVVRSKRGRSQALPFRFRDSVVEPLRRSGAARAPKKRFLGA